MYPLQVDTAAIYQFSPEELVDKALKTLQDAGIEIIEWLSLLHRRMKVPVIIKASDILSHRQIFFLYILRTGLPLPHPGSTAGCGVQASC